MDRKANYVIVEQRNEYVLIRDIGPWDKFMTVTNAAESVVKDLTGSGLLENRKLYYVDSEGELDEIVIMSGAFAGFRPGPQRRWMARK